MLAARLKYKAPKILFFSFVLSAFVIIQSFITNLTETILRQIIGEQEHHILLLVHKSSPIPLAPFIIR
ncbi:hypothetical protein NBRC111894_4204 [Sporolactobacillus inulinus]|uniref:Uncharacterized protein n=1 Tax=Sporolactobacillus inulinus TaxID=2078 RepID=A0A4Y1ZI13_9BACL|nr:hypothetical protein NBRC111894_4204 [Sporolactobacillus inulinus]